MAISPTFLREVFEVAGKARRFNVSLAGAVSFDLKQPEIARICVEIVAPIHALADECRVYGQLETTVFRKFLPNVTRIGKIYSVNLTREAVTGFPEYWGAYGAQRGTVVWTASVEDEPLAQILAKTADPGFLANLATIASPAAVRFATKATATDQTKVAFLLSANRGLNELFVFTHQARIQGAFELAFERCHYSPRYLKLRGEL